MIILKPILFILVILFLIFFCYWMVCEGDNVKRQQHDAIEDDYI